MGGSVVAGVDIGGVLSEDRFTPDTSFPRIFSRIGDTVRATPASSGSSSLTARFSSSSSSSSGAGAGAGSGAIALDDAGGDWVGGMAAGVSSSAVFSVRVATRPADASGTAASLGCAACVDGGVRTGNSTEGGRAVVPLLQVC